MVFKKSLTNETIFRKYFIQQVLEYDTNRTELNEKQNKN